MVAETVTVAPTLGILVLVVVALILWSRSRGRKRDTTRECPHCRERMRGEASVCPHCQRESEPWQFHDGRWWRRDGENWEYLAASGDGGTVWRKFVQDAAATRTP